MGRPWHARGWFLATCAENSKSFLQETGFFCCWGGSWDTPYGRFFLEWYAKSLVDHGERLLRAASRIFNFRLPASRLRQTPQGAPTDARPRTQSVVCPFPTLFG